MTGVFMGPLAPCPFCGEDEALTINSGRKYSWVACGICFGRGGQGVSPKVAREAWNSRHQATRATTRFDNDDAAKSLYDTWSDQPGWVPWVERGNSTMQERARREVTL